MHTDTTRTFPREIVYSPTYGTSIIGEIYLDNDIAFNIIESPITHSAVREGWTWANLLAALVEAGTITETQAEDTWRPPSGWPHATIVTVNGPYIINTDNIDQIIVRDEIHWRT